MDEFNINPLKLTFYLIFLSYEGNFFSLLFDQLVFYSLFSDTFINVNLRLKLSDHFIPLSLKNLL